MKVRGFLIALTLLVETTWGASARAGFSLSFDSAGYAIAAPGGTAMVRLLVAQDATGPQVTPADPLIAGSVRVSFGGTAGVAAVLVDGDVSAGPGWDSAGIEVLADHVELSLASLNGLDFAAGPILLGTFTFRGLAAGTTILSAAELDPATPDFITASGIVLDPVAPANASLAVRAAGAVPEPSSLASGSIAVLFVLGGLRRHRARAAWQARRA